MTQLVQNSHLASIYYQFIEQSVQILASHVTVAHKKFNEFKKHAAACLQIQHNKCV